MPLPGDLSVVQVTGSYVDLQGNPIAGQVRFTPRATVVDPAFNQIIIAGPITATLDVFGSFSLFLPATDDPDVTPTNFTYLVEESFPGGRSYDIAVPAATVGSLNLADVVPAVSSPGVASQYVSSSQYSALNAQVQSIATVTNTVTGIVTVVNTAAAQAASAATSASTAASAATTAAQAATDYANNNLHPFLLMGV